MWQRGDRGGDAPRELRSETLELDGLDCPDCAASLEKAVAAIDGVASAEVSYAASTLRVAYAPHVTGLDQIEASVRKAGYGLKAPAQRFRIWRSRPRGMATAASGGLLAAGFLLSAIVGPTVVAAVLFGLAVVVGGHRIARSALFALGARRADMNVLMSAAVVGAIAIGEWTEAALVVFLFSLASELQSYTMDRARRSIRSLIQLSPSEATALRDGQQVKVPVEQISVGEIVLVRPGERVAVDGVVVGGSSAVDQSPITGESIPVEKGIGDNVFAGTVNQWGVLEVRSTCPYRENTLSRIIEMVEDAQERKARSQQFVDRFARYYTPAVIALATVVAVVPPLFLDAHFAVWLYRGLVLLVIACPCALVISTPVSIAAGIAAASRNGVLFKGGSYLESVGSIPVVVFDKTGTLTNGSPEVTDVIAFDGHSAEEVLAIAAALEAVSEHPLGEAVLRHARQKGLEVPRVSDFRALPGLGAVGKVDGRDCFIGNARLAEEIVGPTLRLPPGLDELQRQGKTVVLVGHEKTLIGAVAAADRLRAGCKRAVAGLREIGIERVVLLTGDNERTAAAIASMIGADDYRAGLLPEDKRAAVEALVATHGRVVMVGDGVNDAPALASATVGIAMGAVGSAVALETADVALMSDDLTKLPYLIRLSRRTVRTIQQNVALSILVKLAFLVLATAGIASLWMAVLADLGTSLVVIGNGMLLLRRDE